MPKHPNFFIVGAPKCGTTALHRYLLTHPNVYMHRFVKEPHFFSETSGYRSVGSIEEYLELFAPAKEEQSRIGEASVFYLYDKEALKHIHQFAPDAKIIVMLRNPVDLVHSLHNHLLLELAEECPSFEEAWSLQEDRQGGRFIPPRCVEPLSLQYRTIGKLGTAVEHLFDIFPSEQVLMLLQEDLAKDPLLVYRAVLNHLEIPYDGRVDFPRINEAKRFRSRRVTTFLKYPPPLINKMRISIKKLLGIRRTRILYNLRQLNATNSQKAPLSSEMRLKLQNCLVSDQVGHLSRGKLKETFKPIKTIKEIKNGEERIRKSIGKSNDQDHPSQSEAETQC